MTTHATLIRDYACAQCHGPLVEQYDKSADLFIVVCPKKCLPGGFVTQIWADQRRAESAAELDEVARNYPQLDPRPAQDRKAMRCALFGEET